MTLNDSVIVLKYMIEYLDLNSDVSTALKVAVDAIERTIDIEQWDSEEAQIENICHRCNGQGCTKCS